EFQLFRSLELQLRPASDGVQAIDLSLRQRRITIHENTPAIGAADAANRASAVELPGESKAGTQRNLPIRHSGPTIAVMIELPCLPRVVPAGSKSDRSTEQ